MEPAAPCQCLTDPAGLLAGHRELGLDDHLADVSLKVCRICGRHWLRYFYEVEAFSRSGRWYLGQIPAEVAAGLSANQAKGTLEGLPWYFYGGSYFDGRVGKSNGPIYLNP